MSDQFNWILLSFDSLDKSFIKYWINISVLLPRLVFLLENITKVVRLVLIQDIRLLLIITTLTLNQQLTMNSSIPSSQPFKVIRKHQVEWMLKKEPQKIIKIVIREDIMWPQLKSLTKCHLWLGKILVRLKNQDQIVQEAEIWHQQKVTTEVIVIFILRQL